MRSSKSLCVLPKSQNVPKYSKVNKAICSSNHQTLYSISERMLPYQETKVRCKQAQKRLELHVIRISTNPIPKNRTLKTRRSTYNERRTTKGEIPWQKFYKAQLNKYYKIGPNTYNPEMPYQIYDPTLFDEKRLDSSGWAPFFGPNMGRHKLKKFKHFPDSPYAKFLKTPKGRKYYDLLNEDSMKPTKHRYWS